MRITAEVGKGGRSGGGRWEGEVLLTPWVFLSGFREGRPNSFNWFLPRDFFFSLSLFYWAKGSWCSASSLLLSQQSLRLCFFFFLFPFLFAIFFFTQGYISILFFDFITARPIRGVYRPIRGSSAVHFIEAARLFDCGRIEN